MATEPLFLERISISNFRAYPAEFTLNLPPGPGVTLLSGPNGLGKTSLFEAIEWALTADVKRLSALAKNKLDGRYLLRQNSGTSCEVSLVFSGGLHVRRLQTVGTNVTVVGNELAEVAEALRAPDVRWRVSGDNLAEYLHLTHFHPQSAELRLVSLDPDDRWVRVSPLAGADRFDRFRANLRTARSGLTRAIKSREQTLEFAKQREALWIRRLDEYRTISRVDRAAHGALSPHEALDALAPTFQLLQQRISESRDVSSADIASAIADLKTELDRMLGMARAEEGRLRAITEFPTLWVRARASYESANGRRTKAQASLAEAEGRHRQSQRIVDEGVAALEKVATTVSLTEQRHRLGAALQGHQGALARAIAQLDSLRSVCEDQEAQVNARQAELQREIVAHGRFQTDETARRALVESITSTRTAQQRLSESLEVERQLDQQKQRISAKSTQLESVRSAYAAFEVELRSTRGQRAEIIGRLEVEAARLGEVARAVTTIAAHLVEHDDSCPVCKTEFPIGQLRKRALQQSAASSASLGSLQKELETADRNVLYLESKGRELSTQVRAVEQELASLTAIAMQLSARITVLRNDPMIVPVEGAEQRLQALIASREAELGALLARIASSPTEQELTGRLGAARMAVTNASRDLDTTRAQQEKLGAERSEFTAKIASVREALKLGDNVSVSNLVSALAQEFAKAETQRVAASEAVSLAKATNDVAVQEVDAARQLLAVASAEVARAEGELASMQRRWVELALPGEPSESVLQNALVSLASRQSALADAGPTLLAVGTALEEWQRLDASRKLQADLITEAGGLSLEDHSAALRKAVVVAERSLKATREAYDASEKLTGAVRQVGEGFGSNAIAPFAEMFKAFLRALVRDARFHRISPEFARTKGGGNVLRFNLDLDEQSGESSFQVELVLSEGQLSEVSLAAMLAASCIYPWSRWRGVLLDDPTQYQDLTHSTSLFEIIRNLATDAGFQVIVAVHDRAQADFLVRKLVSARVNHVECEYLAIGPHGALTRVSRPPS